ncbi:unnamed protein product, partial [Didymodactylos carnosus]
YSHPQLGCSQWLNMIMAACFNQEYSFSYTCMNIITILFHKNNKQFWIQKGEEYQKLSLDDDVSNDTKITYTILSLLWFIQARLDGNDLFYKCLQYDDETNRSQYNQALVYLSYIKSKYDTSLQWEKLGEIVIKLNKNRLAMFCFQQSSSKQTTTNLINKMISQHLIQMIHESSSQNTLNRNP